MYSVISVNGHQYKVQPGDTIVVDKLDSGENSTVSYPSLLFVNGKEVKVGKSAATIKVAAKVIKHYKGVKIDVARFKAKSRYRRHVGFRPQLTKLKIEQIEQPAKAEPKTVSTPKSRVKTKSK